MKRKLSILFSFILLAVFSANAQVGDPRCDFSIGASAGYTLNSMDFVPKIKQGMKGSPSFGFATRYICEKYFSTVCGVEIEAQFNNLGWKEIIEDGSQNEYYRDMKFIQIPVLMQMGWGKERNGFKFLFEAGPQFGVYLSGEEHKGGEYWFPDNRPNGVNFQYGLMPDNKFDYGIAAGFGLEFSNPVGHFLLQARYYYGLGDVFDNSKRGVFGRSANQTIGVRLTYLFDIISTNNDNIK